MEAKQKSKMKIIWKIICLVIIVGVVLAITGLVLGASRSLYWDRTGIHVTGSGITSIVEHDIAPFKNIYIDAGFSDVEFKTSDSFGIDLFGDNMEWIWTLENDVLNITHDKNTRFQFLNFDFSRNHAIIYLPDKIELDAINVKTDSGNIKLGGFSARNLNVNNKFGNVDLSNIITAGYIQLELNSGNFTGLNLETQNLTYSNHFGIGRFQSVNSNTFRADSKSGDLQFIDCGFENAVIENNFGKITATGLIATSPNIRANSGDISIAGDISGEIIVHNEFGNITLTTSRKKSDFSYDISIKFGRLTFDGERLRDQTSIVSSSVLENHIKITSSSGNVDISFEG